MYPPKRVLSKLNFKLSLFVILIFTLIPKFDTTDGGKHEGPDSILIRYLEASYNSKFDVAYQQISSEDKSMLTLSKFVSQRKGSRVSSGFLGDGEYSYQIMLIIDDQTAEVEIEVQKSSFLKKLSKYFDQALITMIGFERGVISETRRGSPKKFEALFTKSVKRYRLHKENDGWKVFLGLKQKESPSIDAAT